MNLLLQMSIAENSLIQTACACFDLSGFGKASFAKELRWPAVRNHFKIAAATLPFNLPTTTLISSLSGFANM